jgi:hypothetical protein
MQDQPLDIRDKYTSLTWIGGTAAWSGLNRPSDAVAMFDRYSRAGRSLQVLTKGQYWAGKAAMSARRTADGIAYFQRAAAYPELFYGQLSLEQIGATLDDLTRRAREGKLDRSDVSGGSFTISNHGVSGSLLAAPIILHQGQAAILGIGKLEKRVIVREVNGQDALLIRPMAYVTLTIDHRVVDGHQTNAWLTRFVDILEGWPPA